MHKSTLLFLLLCFPFLLLSQTSKKVIIIGIDGCRVDALQVANTPNIDRLIADGIFSGDALNDDITISGPGWSANLCGVWSDKHLVLNNDFSNNDYATYPSIFKYINDHNSDLHTVSICHWAPINDFIVQDHADFKLNVSSDLEVATQAATYISVNDPDFTFLHFDDVDHAGHGSGFSPSNSAYLAAIEDIDGHVGTVVQAIEQRSTFAEEDWLFIVTTDHGGLGTSHGSNSFDEQNVFFIASGKSITPAVIKKDSMIVTDLADNCLGDSTELKFDGSDDFVQVPPDSLFNFGADRDFTVECRVRTSVSADVAIIGNKDWDSGANKGFVFSFKFPSGPEWKVNIGDGNTRADINTGGAIADNKWYTLSVSFDRDGQMYMYQDGVLLDSADISAIGDINTNEGLFFGADINSNYDYSGAISEVRVWDGLLSSTIISDWHCSTIESNHPQFDKLLGYWKLNEGAGATEAIDYSSFANNGSITDAAWEVPDSIIVYDYSATPRLPDVPVTALAHLCIPIDSNWNLDGQSLIPICMPTATEELEASLSKIQLFPNPSNSKVQINLEQVVNQLPLQLKVYHANGQMVYKQTISTDEVILDVSAYPPGVYYFTFEIKNQIKGHKKLIVPAR